MVIVSAMHAGGAEELQNADEVLVTLHIIGQIGVAGIYFYPFNL